MIEDDGVATVAAVQEISLEAWEAQCEKLGSSLERIRLSLDWMKKALEVQGAPCFRMFWEIRKQCLPWFKENLSPKWRVLLWKEYALLSEEARNVKNIFDEKAAFAAEQLELAIASIEHDLEQLPLLRAEMPAPWERRPPRCLEKKASFYSELHGEMALLNALATRERALHAELARTDMRVRIKNTLFNRLMTCRHRIVSRRTALVEEVSKAFLGEVTTFVSLAFSKKEERGEDLQRVRQEIQALQALAKKMPLNHTSFKESREKLSLCWGTLKEKEEGVKQFLSKQQDERQKIRAEAEERHRKEQERLRALEEQKALHSKSIRALEQRLEDLRQRIETIPLEEICEERDSLLKEIEKVMPNPLEKQRLEMSFRKIADRLREKREESLLSLSTEDATVLKQLLAMLEESRAQRIEVKRNLEGYRRALGGSGFDFEKAILYRGFVEVAKQDLEKLNISIEVLEERIEHLQLKGYDYN